MHRVVLIERFEVGVDALDILPGWRHQHAQRPGQLNTASGQQLQHIVQTRGIRARSVDEGRHRLEIGQQRRLESRSSRRGPVTVPFDGINFTVVRQHAEGLSQGPTGKGVGGEALMEHTDRRRQLGVAEIRIEMLQIRGHDEAFVGNDLVRQTADVEVLIAFHRDF